MDDDASVDGIGRMDPLRGRIRTSVQLLAFFQSTRRVLVRSNHQTSDLHQRNIAASEQPRRTVAKGRSRRTRPQHVGRLHDASFGRESHVGGFGSSPVQLRRFTKVRVWEWACSGAKLCDSGSDLGVWRLLVSFLSSQSKMPGDCSRDDPCSCISLGVLCDGDRIVSLDLSSVGIAGSFKENDVDLGRLDALRSIDLRGNPSLTDECVDTVVSPASNSPRSCFVDDSSDDAGVTASPTPSTLVPSELEAWIRLFDDVNGASCCPSSREDPCTCVRSASTYVACFDGHVTDIRLDECLGLIGRVDLNDLREFSWLQTVSFPQSVTFPEEDFTTSGEGCVTLEFCSQPMVTCDFKNVTLCEASDSPTAFPTVATGAPTTPLPTLASADLDAWRSIFDSLSGPSWFKCKFLRDDPCSCNPTGKEIRCEVRNGSIRIVGINLLNNKLRGTV